MFDYVELEPATVKGKSEPVQVWQAVAPLARFGTDVTRRHDSPLVGREIDLALLKGVFDKTVASASPQLVTIVGEPGLGKSRLVAELFAHVDAQAGLVTWRQGRCLPYGDGITFWALGEIVKAHAGVYDTDTADVAVAKLDAVLPDIDERNWLRQRLLPLLGMEASSTAEQSELFTAWRRFLEHVADAGPTVVVFEDLHWADPALLAFIEHLAQRAEEVPLLIVATARPEFFDQHPDYGRGLRNTTTINLTPLTDQETRRMVSALLQTVAVPEELLAPLVERAGGNPLFAEEYVRLLQDRDLIERVDDQVQLRPDAELPLPDNVQALIAARLDTLPPDRKSLLADAAAVGKVFWAGAVATMANRDEGEVIEAMRELSRKELIRPVRTSSMSGQAEYTFWHVLTRDVAYAQLPRRSRAARHVAAARWVEQQTQNRVEDLADVLVYHYSTALDLALATGDVELAERARPAAVTYLEMAGERAVGLDTSSATILLSRAVELMPEDHPGRSRILVTYGKALLHAGRTADAAPVLEQALALFEVAGDARGAATTLNQLGLVYERRNDPRWVKLPRQAWSMLQGEPPGVEHVQALTELAATAMITNRHHDAIEHADQAVALAARLRMEVPARALGFRAIARSQLGDETGLDDMHHAIALATAAGQGREVAVMSLNLAGEIDLRVGPAAGLKASREGIAYARTRGLNDTADMMEAGSLDCLLDLGRLDEAINLATDLAASLETSGNIRTLLWTMSSQVRALALSGDESKLLEFLTRLDAAAPADSESPESFAIGYGAAALGHAALGRDDRAVELLASVAAHAQVNGSMAAARQLTAWVRVLVRADQVVLAERIVAGLQPTYRQVQLALATTKAAFAEAREDHEIAVSAYNDAAAHWHDFTAVTEQAFALLGQGRCLLALNRHDEAVPLLARARDMFAQMGARPALAETEALLTGLA